MDLRELMEDDLETVFFSDESQKATVEINGESISVIPEYGIGDKTTINTENRGKIARFSAKSSELLSSIGRSAFQSGDIIDDGENEWNFDSILSDDGLIVRALWTAEESVVRLK